MTKKALYIGISVICMIMLTMVLIQTESLTVYASAPDKEKVSYLGSGKVEVEFLGDVEYRKPKVTVKDASGKKYKAYIYNTDDDEIKFKIKNYKTGKRYTFTISGIRKEFTSKYGKVKGNVYIEKKSTKNIDLEKAKKIALQDAEKHYKVSGDQVTNMYAKKDREDGIIVYEVQFKANGWEYEYTISMKGKILEREREWD